MNKTRLIRFLSVVLLAALSAFSCRRETAESQQAELQVALYIPDAVMTRADDPSVNPLPAEKTVTTLHVWAFLHDTGELVSYKLFDSNLDQSGLSHSTVTRFGLPLTDEMFETLTTESGSPAARPTVDVFAIANAASALNDELPEYDPNETPGTLRTQLKALVVDGIGGNNPLTRAVPTAGLPMSGMLENVSVTGGYPVLNITTLKLTRAVSKIRFVFCQQINPNVTPPAPVNNHCKIISVQFDGVENEKDCQIANTERLFTTQSFDIGGTSASYSPLNASIKGTDNTPLISNAQLARAEDPEELYYRSSGHDTESVEQYEKRLATALDGYPNSQVGPIYLRETDKRISGTITYQIEDGGEEKNKTVPFSMELGEVFSRNHSWVVYACFAQETMSLQLRVVVMPWDYTDYFLDYTTDAVNVIRRFTVSETNPATFRKEETQDGFFDVTFWHTVRIDEADVENKLHGDIIIDSPINGKLYVAPVAKTLKETDTFVSDAFKIESVPSQEPDGGIPIYRNHLNAQGVIEDCLISITISCYHPDDGSHTDEALEGNYIDLHFYVKTPGGREIDLGSESIDYYRFILSKDWNKPKPTEGNNNNEGNNNG